VLPESVCVPEVRLDEPHNVQPRWRSANAIPFLTSCY
jgi:hypothetical protein